MRIPVWTLWVLAAILVAMLWPLSAALIEGGPLMRAILAGFAAGATFMMLCYEVRDRRLDRQR